MRLYSLLLSISVICTSIVGLNGITFRATSNNVKPKRRKGNGSSLHKLMIESAPFTEAFKKRPGQIIQSSNPHDGRVQEAHYGLVSAILDAYNNHLNLVLRPDDVWQAVLTQFSFYVNANAEDLRDLFVDFQGKKKLTIEMFGTLFSADFGHFAERMVDEQIVSNLKNPNVTEWLIPNFTTTTTEDRIVASVTIMSTLQSYFEYECALRCGIPEVTLEGTPEDWRLLREKIKKLHNYDIKGKDQIMSKWQNLLMPVMDEFVKSAEGNPNLAFWDRICSKMGGGSGPTFVSGWVTVFSSLKADGSWQGLSSDGSPWATIDTNELSIGVVSVPVLVDDNGVEYDTHMFAGQFAYELIGDKMDTVRPRNDWSIAYDGRSKKKVTKVIGSSDNILLEGK